MNDLATPLARWDGLHVVLDLARVERHLNDALAASERLRDLRLTGKGDALAAELTVRWKGIPARVSLDLAEIRMRHRHLGFRMRRVRAVGGFPVPRKAVELGFLALDNPRVKVFKGQGIVVVDLRRWLSNELHLRILTVQGTSRSLSLWFGPGNLEELPARGPRALPASVDSDVQPRRRAHQEETSGV